MQTELEQSIISEGRQLFNAIKNEQESLFDKQYWLGRMMEWVMRDPEFKVDLFRFVDVLPVLHTKDQVAKHIQEYLVQKDRELPKLMGTALKAASFSFARGLAAATIRKNVTEMAQRFIIGQDIKSAAKSLIKLHAQGFCTTLDLLGEKVLSNQESDTYFERYQEIIAELPQIIAPHQANVSIKVSALSCHLQEEDPKHSVIAAKERVMPLLRMAKNKNVFINFDLESFQSVEIIYNLVHDIILSDEYRSWPHIGIVVQAYLRSASSYLHDLIAACRQRQAPITIRLVKGAYWDYEVVRAEQLGYSCPVFKHKAETDQNFEKLSKVMLDNHDVIRPAFGSHNIRSLSHALAYAKSKKIPAHNFEIQMLYGMAEGERKALLKQGYQVRLYVPIGDLLPGMSYLVRRLLENTSQMGFLKLSHHDGIAEDILLSSPTLTTSKESKEKTPEFSNEGHLDFTQAEVRNLFSKALVEVSELLPIKVPIVVSQESSSSTKILERVSPNNNTKIFAHISMSDTQHAQKAVATCVESFPELKAMALEERCKHLLNLGEILKKDRYVLAALMCHEVGKTWAEADADVAEAIDFCRYYASRALVELQTRPAGLMSGEHNTLSFQGRGPTVVIAPWNFPLAILCGMSVAAYVSGNPIIMKPAEQSSVTGYYLFVRMLKAGFLPKAIHFLPGLGEELGPFLVSHPHVANICFTGSRLVGHEIMKTANTVVKGQTQMKRVICEMGGKNAIIIDDDADLDEAVWAVLKSAFAYAGQKCSAASRIIIVGGIKDQFIKRLCEATDSLLTGSSLLAHTELGPVIDAEAFERLQLRIKDLMVDPSIKICHAGEVILGGYHVPPCIVEVSDPRHWVMQEELFGPIVAIHAVENLEQALAAANGTAYALTGAIFSRSPENIALAKANFNVGNLYINQKCTGAIVNRQPFGGFKMSGTGIKAGGPHYLLNFVDQKTTSENTMRRGFTPEMAF